jgi:hypothetical protein
MRHVFPFASILTALFTFASALRADSPHVIQQGTTDWTNAARSSRADMLVIGDSLTNGGNGWDYGFMNAAAAKFGLAGSALTVDDGLGGYGDGSVYIGTVQDPALDRNRADVHNSKSNYVWPNPVSAPITAGATPLGGYFFSISPSGPLDPAAAYDWHVWTSSTPEGGQFSAARTLSAPPYTVIQTIPSLTTSNPALGLQHHVLHFDAVQGHDGEATGGGIDGLTNTSIFYSRLVKPNAVGVTVTTWSYGGHSTLEFLRDRYDDGTFDDEGRAAFYRALVEGGSGKLNVVLSEGFNDTSRPDLPSQNGILPGNSGAAFLDNVTTLIDKMRADWSRAGFSNRDLSFTLLGEWNYGDSPLIDDYANALRNLALSDHAISFIDMRAIAPPYDQAVAEGYFAPGEIIHQTRAGSIEFATQALDLLDVPEPGGLLALCGLPLLLRRRRRHVSTSRQPER